MAVDTTGAVLASYTFVGRAREVEQIRAGLADAACGCGRMFLIAGEPGVGKTRLASEAALEAEARGMRVLWGRCWEGGGAPAHWPWRQILRTYAAASDVDLLRAQLGAGVAEVAQIAPEILTILRGPELAETSAMSPLEPENARFRLFDSLMLFFKRAAEQQPLVVVFDDLHAADQASLLLLQFLARELHDAAIVVIVTYRDAEVRRTPSLAAIVGSLARESLRIPLSGLNAEEAGALMRQSRPEPVPAALAKAIHEATNGNPFFVDEVMRLVATGTVDPLPGAVLKVPDRVREAIRQRLQPLGEEAHRALAIASILGREFETATLQRVAAISAVDLLHIMEEAVTAGVIRSTGSTAYAFSHGLMREALRQELLPTERMRLHLQVARVLAADGTSRRPVSDAEVAHHFLQAAPIGGAEEAIAWSVRAAAEALQQWGYEDAVLHYENALAALNFGQEDEYRRCTLLLDLAEAQRRAGAPEKTRETCRRAAAIAREIDRPEELAQAAIILGRGGETGAADPVLLELLEAAAEALGSSQAALRSRVLSRLAMALYFAPQRQRRMAISDRSLAEARRSGDLDALVTALVARHFVILEPGTMAERLAVSHELARHAAMIGSHEMALEGQMWHAIDLYEAGDAPESARMLADYAESAVALRLPLHRWHAETVRATQALLLGDLETAERLAVNASALAQYASSRRVEMAFAIQMFYVRREQGRLAEIQANIEALDARFAGLPVWRCALAYLYVEVGQMEDAARVLESLAGSRFEGIPFDLNWIAAMANLANVSVALHDVARATQIYELLSPYSGSNVVVAEILAYPGPVDLFLGRLAMCLGKWAEAERFLMQAIDMATCFNAPLLVLEGRAEYARLLLRAPASENFDHNGAAALAAEVRAAAQKLGLRRIETLTDSVEAGATPAAEVPSPPASTASGVETAAVFRRDGQYWTITFGATTSRLKHSRGLAYIDHLLQHPGRELIATDLAQLTQAVATDTSYARELLRSGELSVDSMGGDIVLDAQAKGAYRKRLAELREELQEAEEFNDVGRAELARDEIDAITRELSSALGLAGRDRTQGSNSERARVAVTKAILSALKLIDAANPLLRQYFDRTIKTGRFCSYNPDPATPVCWTSTANRA